MRMRATTFWRSSSRTRGLAPVPPRTWRPVSARGARQRGSSEEDAPDGETGEEELPPPPPPLLLAL